MNDGGPAKRCSKCVRPAYMRQGHQWLCAMHYRFGQMRANAKRNGKEVPTHDQLNDLMEATNGSRCFGCHKIMNWLSGTNQSLVISLQHDRDGTLRLLCRGCNTRHAIHPGDTYYAVPTNGKWCPDCDLVLTRDQFCRDRSRPIGLKSYCKACSKKKHDLWRKKNRTHYNAYQRKQRATRKARSADAMLAAREKGQSDG